MFVVVPRRCAILARPRCAATHLRVMRSWRGKDSQGFSRRHCTVWASSHSACMPGQANSSRPDGVMVAVSSAWALGVANHRTPMPMTATRIRDSMIFPRYFSGQAPVSQAHIAIKLDKADCSQWPGFGGRGDDGGGCTNQAEDAQQGHGPLRGSQKLCSSAGASKSRAARNSTSAAVGRCGHFTGLPSRAGAARGLHPLAEEWCCAA